MPVALNIIRREAWEAHAQQRWLDAEERYRSLLAKDPSVDDVINLGALLRSQGRLQEGSIFYQHWLKHFGNDQRLLLNACNCWNDHGQSALSVQQLEPWLQRDPNNRAIRMALAEALMNVGRADCSLTLLEPMRVQMPDNKELWVRLGLCHSRLQQLPAALEAFAQAQQLDPSDLQMLANRITILKDLGRFDDADQLIDALSQEQRGNLDVTNAIAGFWMCQERLEEASQLYQQLAQRKPDAAGHWLNWAAALKGLRHTVAPALILKRGLQYQPENEELRQALHQILAEMALPEACQRLKELWTNHNTPAKTSHLFSQQFLGIGAAPADSHALAEQARAWEQRCTASSPGVIWPDLMLEPTEGRPLRVGYLSADFANHPVGRFLLPVLTHHNKETVETWLLSVGCHDDWISEHLRQRADHWLDLRYRTSLQAARLIADLRLDVLVELGGFTADSGLEILCHRPAPVQLSYLGYPGPTYLRCIDGWIGDSVLFEQLNDCDRKAHQLLELDGGYMVFDSGGELPLPSRCEASRFRFGSFNHARKLSTQTIELFCRVLQANPDSELVLKSISFREAAEQARIRARFEAAGLASERLILLDWVEGGLNHLQLYKEVDVALDPIPYGGATTTAEALWMGVPVIAMAGRGMVGRLAASLLVHGERPEWLARSQEQYISISTQLAAAGPRDAAARLELRKALKNSPLADGQRLSRELERCYLELRKTARSC